MSKKPIKTLNEIKNLNDAIEYMENLYDVVEKAAKRMGDERFSEHERFKEDGRAHGIRNGIAVLKKLKQIQ